MRMPNTIGFTENNLHCNIEYCQNMCYFEICMKLNMSCFSSETRVNH